MEAFQKNLPDYYIISSRSTSRPLDVAVDRGHLELSKFRIATLFKEIQRGEKPGKGHHFELLVSCQLNC